MNIFQIIQNIHRSVVIQKFLRSIANHRTSLPAEPATTAKQIKRPKTKLEIVALALKSSEIDNNTLKINSNNFRQETAQISPKDTNSASDIIRSTASNYYYYKKGSPKASSYVKQYCLAVPDFAFYAIHSNNGYDRELALTYIKGELNPFEAMYLTYLANNWVPEVQVAAIDAISRCFPQTNAQTLFIILPAFIENSKQWSRWNAKSRPSLRQHLIRPEVIDAFIEDLMEQQSPHAIKIFNYLLKTKDIDDKLEQIRLHSQSPSVRAIATKVLLFGEATWKNGYTRKWVDKSLGQSRREPIIEHRTLSSLLQKEPILADAIKSPYWSVRKVAADALIKYRNELDLPIEQLAQQLLQDKYPSIQERGKFLLSALDQQ